MDTVEHLRQFVGERLTAAAEEIFGVFTKTIVEFEKEIERQRALLDVALGPEGKLQKIAPDQPDCEVEEGLAELHPGFQDDPEPPRIKEEPEVPLVPPKDNPGDDDGDPPDAAQGIPSESGSTATGCKVCGKVFSHKKVVIRHMRIHTGEKPYTCSICGKAFRYYSSLSKHIRVHTGYRPYSCNTCGKKFSDNSQYHVHMRIHTGEKPYCCGICGKRFPYSSSLTQHMSVHTDSKPFSCNTCGRRFSRKSNLISHTRTHKGESTTLLAPVGNTSDTFFCRICGKGFGYMWNLKRHTRKQHAKAQDLTS